MCILGNRTLAYILKGNIAFLVELFPFAVRARGITIFQLFGRLAGFFNQYVNPIGIGNAGWKYYLSYVYVSLLQAANGRMLMPVTDQHLACI